jgi:hypothetical protein
VARVGRLRAAPPCGRPVARDEWLRTAPTPPRIHLSRHIAVLCVPRLRFLAPWGRVIVFVQHVITRVSCRHKRTKGLDYLILNFKFKNLHYPLAPVAGAWPEAEAASGARGGVLL